MRTPLVSFIAAAIVAASGHAQQSARWSVDTKPTLTLGRSDADTTDMFTRVVGATRLPNGQILVGDVGRFALRLFSADGKPVRQFGRQGGGPGEISYLVRLNNCGNEIVTSDAESGRVTAFTLGGAYVRSFRFTSPMAGTAPYKSVCNSRGDFVHFAFETRADVRAGTYRAIVPLWLTKADSGVRGVLARIPGSERFEMDVRWWRRRRATSTMRVSSSWLACRKRVARW